MAQIFAVVIAVAVSVVSMGTGSIVGAMLIGAAGAAATQGVMIAAGEQHGFDWKGMAIGAVSAGIGAAAAPATSFWTAAARGAVRSAATQGMALAVGAQRGFDWKGMAASAVASGVGFQAARTINVGGSNLGFDMGSDPGRFVTGMGAGIAAGAASTIVRGGSLGRNVGAISMDAVAATIGSLVVDQVQAASVGKTGVNATGTNGSMSGLFGAGGNYDDLVRQTTQQSYNVDAGNQFAGMAGWNLALQGQATTAGTGRAANGYVGDMPSAYGGASFNVEQARAQRIAELQVQAWNSADVRPALGELNILVTGVGSRYETGAVPSGLIGVSYDNTMPRWSTPEVGGDISLATLALNSIGNGPSYASPQTAATIDGLRAPDFVTLQVDYFVGSGSITLTRSGSLYGAVGLNLVMPNPLNAGASVSVGYLNTSHLAPGQVDDFASGYAGGGIAAYRGLGGGILVSPGNGTATIAGFGVGVNVGKTNSPLQASLGYATKWTNLGFGW
ncbi:hypothetical protein HDG39_007081 [Paraburkholderia sp. WSM4180]|nr:hypothetical protein [Paraburkholderia sp. WSM4180]